jgi:hypothetical protein
MVFEIRTGRKLLGDDDKFGDWIQVEKEGYLEGLLQPGSVYSERNDTRWDISQEEIKILADLLRGLLRFEGRERVSADLLLKHSWFELGSGS